MRSLPVRDHWCASFHLATVLAAVGHRSCGRGVCVWCARRSRLRGLTPSRVCGRHPVGRAGGCLPGGYPQGLPTGANTPKRTPKAHHEAHTARAFSKRPETTNNPQATTNHNHNQSNRRQLGSDHAPRSPALAMRQAQPTAGVSMATTHPHRGSTADTNPAHNAGTPATSHNLVARAENPNAGVCGRAPRGVQRRGFWHLSKRPPGRLAR